MKLQLKGIIIGLLIGTFLTSGIALAVSNTTTLENVLVGGIRLVVDGREYTPTNANGEVVQPILYNGTTYLPVRAVATAFDKAVYWDDSEKTVYLGKMNGKLEKPTALMSEMTNIAGRNDELHYMKNVTANDEKTFFNSAIYCDLIPKDCCEVQLHGKYSKFKATAFVRQGTTGGAYSFAIVGDEKILYKSDEFTKLTYPVDFVVDVTGVNDLKILFNNYSKNFLLANAGFYQ